MSLKRMPDFLIIGAAKSGTTSLYYYLLQHPQIFMPENKEPFFFSFEGKDLTKYHYEGKMRALSNTVTEIGQYQQLYEKSPSNCKKGEASTIYLYDRETPGRIFHYAPEAKLIAILRNPVARAYSHFQNFRRDGLDPIQDFSEVVRLEPLRIKENWFPTYFYVDTGFYAQQLTNYFQFFQKSQIKVFLYEDLQDMNKLLRELCEFIEIDPYFEFNTSTKFNISGKVRFPWIYKNFKKSKRVKNFFRKIVSPKLWGRLKSIYDNVLLSGNESIEQDVKNQLINVYREDILTLQDLLNRDLSHWLY